MDSAVASNVEHRIPMSAIPHLGQELRGGPLASAALGAPDADIGMALFATAEPRGEKAAVAQLHQCRGVALGKGLLAGKEVFANVDQRSVVLVADIGALQRPVGIDLGRVVDPSETKAR